MRLINGDCIEEMKNLDANCVDTIITDPPYGLSFMGKQWDDFSDNEKLQAWTKEWALQALRVAKPGAIMLCFGGTRTFHRITCGIEDAGWEIRDTMMWLYGSGFPKSYNISKGMNKYLKTGNASWNGTGDSSKGALGYSKLQHEQGYRPSDYSGKHQDSQDVTEEEAQLWDGWGTALKPAFEPIIVAMKPKEGTFVENALKWGVAGLNIDGGRVRFQGSGDENEMRAANKRREKSNNEAGVYKGVFMASKELKPNKATGRWPANIIHDGSEEVLEGFPEGRSSGGGGQAKEDAEPGMFGAGGKGIDFGYGQYYDKGSAARFFYCAKASKKERNAGLDGMEDKERIDYGGFHSEKGLIENNRNPENRKPTKNNHPTVKPLALMEYLARLTSTPTGGTVLDPFMGSGTTGMACKKVGRDFIGIELDEHYFEIAEKRIGSIIQQELI